MKSQPAKTGKPAQSSSGFTQVVLPRLLWGIVVVMVAAVVYLAVNRTPVAFSQTLKATPTQPKVIATASGDPSATLPELATQAPGSLSRAGKLHTNIPERPKVEGQYYKIESGDSVFALAEYFKLKPDTIVWANYSILNDNPDSLNIGQKLYIPATDGVVHKWKEGDTFESVASQYKANAKDILLWPGNKLDIVNPSVAPGTMIMVPGGVREYRRTWVIPVIARGASGVATNMPGTCDTGTGGLVGTGAFIWPGPVHKISGNPFWSGHLGIDIAIGIGTPVAAADSGVAVFSGWSPVGYGNVVMIDHGNGFQTLYAHLTSALVRCGQSVAKGVTIGTGGSTGNSTGPHLHFEIRYNGGFVNPISYLR